MAKKNMTAEQVKAIAEKADELSQELIELEKACGAMRVDPLKIETSGIRTNEYEDVANSLIVLARNACTAALRLGSASSIEESRLLRRTDAIKKTDAAVGKVVEGLHG